MRTLERPSRGYGSNQGKDCIMYKKTITYVDYNGVERTEDFYFNLTKAEIAELDLRHAGGFESYINRIVKSDDNNAIVDTFKSIIAMAYGEKDPNGRRFVKNPRLTEEFMQTEAYSELFVELLTKEGAAADFINGIVPKIDAPTDKPVLAQ